MDKSQSPASSFDPKEAILDLQRNPNHIFELKSHQFERVVAELLASFGWRVNVTPPSRDGGYDILGITTDNSGLQSSWIVECKKYSKDRKIGVDITRPIKGVREHFGIPNALIVTTSTFTKDAREFAASDSALHLVDFSRLSEWISQYTPPQESTYEEARRFSSCFISYSSKDKLFAERLAGRLREAGVPIWFAQEDILPGSKVYDQVKRAIGSADRLLVVLSHESMNSGWVRTELTAAVKRERQEGRHLLFPIALAPISDIKKWECFDADSGIDIAREIREYHIPDFSQWQNEEIFEQQIVAVLSALAAAEPSVNQSYPLLPLALFYTLRHTTTPDAIDHAFRHAHGYKSLKLDLLRMVGTVVLDGHGFHNPIELSPCESHCVIEKSELDSLINEHSGFGESAIKGPIRTTIEILFFQDKSDASLTLTKSFEGKPRNTRKLELFDDTIFQDVFDTGWEVINPSKRLCTIKDLLNARLRLQMRFMSFDDINLERPARLHNLHMYFGKAVPHVLYFRPEELQSPVVKEDPNPVAKWDFSNIGMTARELLLEYEFLVDETLFSERMKQIDLG